MTEDGSIVINTKIRTDGVKAGTAEIEAGVHRAADRVRIPTQHRLDPM